MAKEARSDVEAMSDDDLGLYALALGQRADELKAHRVAVRQEIDRRAAEAAAAALAEGMDPAVLAALQSLEPTPVETSEEVGG